MYGTKKNIIEIYASNQVICKIRKDNISGIFHLKILPDNPLRRIFSRNIRIKDGYNPVHYYFIFCNYTVCNPNILQIKAQQQVRQ
jgi:hypothetical protein